MKKTMDGKKRADRTLVKRATCEPEGGWYVDRKPWKMKDNKEGPAGKVFGDRSSTSKRVDWGFQERSD